MANPSKKLSWLLRHGAPSVNIAMDAAGWVAVSDVLAYLKIGLPDLVKVVADNNKSRLELRDGRIRACQGHSREGMPVTLEALEATWEPFVGKNRLVWHGTTAAATRGISKLGILPGERTHVHLAEELDSKVGKRANVEIMLGVSVEKVGALFRAGNGVVLARHVPADCIVELWATEAPRTKATLDLERELRSHFPAIAERQAETKLALDEMTKETQELGLYDY